MFCLRRRADLDPDEFARYWRDVHGPLVASYAGALRMVGYRQLHPTLPEFNERAGRSRSAPEPFDGIAELDFASFDEMKAAAATPRGRVAASALLDDERRFIDHANSPIFYTETVHFVRA